jgi:hypothetical protein
MRLIVATDSSRADVGAKNALTAFLEAKGWPVWHWFDDLWLIDEAPEQIDLPALRAEILRAIPTLGIILIMSAEGLINHAGLVPGDSVQWFKEHWIRR